MQRNLFFQDTPQLKEPSGDQDQPYRQREDGKDREQETYLRHVKAPVEYGCHNSHIGHYPTEDMAPQHDDRDYKEIDAEDVVTYIESGAVEGGPHRLPRRQEQGSLRVRRRS